MTVEKLIYYALYSISYMTEQIEPIRTVIVKKLHCLRCGYEWIPKYEGKIPKNCANPKCNSPYWNKPRRVKKSEQNKN